MKPLKKINTGITDGQKRKKTSISNSSAMTSSSTHIKITKSSVSDVRTTQNFRAVWLDSSIHEVYDK
jgi:hypothetical protein